MNRFVKNNLALFAVCGASAVAVLVLLVLVAIDYRKMYIYSTEIASLRTQISVLINEKPAPVDENKPRIASDIKLYRKASKELEGYFGHPLQPAFNEFIKALRPEVKQEEFRKKFAEGWAGIDSHNSAQQGVYFKKFQRDYPNWGEAMRVFAKRAGELTTEPIGDQTLDDVFLSLLDVPRHMQYNREKLNTFMSDYRLQALDLLEKAKIVVSANALEFGFHPGGGFSVDDAPLLAFHWDVTGDIVKKLTEAGVKELSEMHRRSLIGEAVGDYHVYHYAFEVSGSLESIRKLCHVLDTGYASRRVYIVRSIALFAIHDQAEALFNQEVSPGGLSEEQLDERIRQKEMRDQLRRQQIEAAGGHVGGGTAEAPPLTPSRRGGRRGVAVPTPEEQQVNTVEAQAQKREQELKSFLADEAAKPFNERFGFGRILVGGTQECRAVICIDYVTRMNVAR